MSLPASSLPHPVTQLNERLSHLRRQLRPGQQRLADWNGGSLAVSAVPGSGKSTGMAIAAALLLARRRQQALATGTMPSDQLLLVTFTRSAAANLKDKIKDYLRSLDIPALGFSVYTLHGLALNIALRHPEWSGLNLDRMSLVSLTQGNRLMRTCVEQWIAANPHLYQHLLEGVRFDGEETECLRRQSVLRTEVLPELAYTAIHEAKSSGLRSHDLRQLGTLSRRVEGMEDYDILTVAAGLYEHYQELLQHRGLIDYDDMILAALRVLENEAVRQQWQSQIFAVFEDEAQDSSPLQTQLLELLATDAESDRLNLIRVGDPNQAINSTFTPADPIFFRHFCERCAQHGQLAEMTRAGRSTRVIMVAANFLLDWVNRSYSAPTPPEHPKGGMSPFRPQVIRPVAADDPQPNANPPAEGWGLEIRFPNDIYQDAELIARRAVGLFERHPDSTMAILVRENKQGTFLSEVLRHPSRYGLAIDLEQVGLSIYDVGQRDRQSHIPAEMLSLLQFLDRPHSPDHLKEALRVLVNRRLIPTQDLNLLTEQSEQFLYPGPLDPPQPDPVIQARRYCAGLLRARLELPQYQLIPFLALTLKYEQSELATADKLAERLNRQTSDRPSMAALLDVLGELVRSERFDPVEVEDTDSRYVRPGQLTIITMHKAKGLDWDAVFIPFLHEQTMPGRLRVLPQAQFLGDFNPAEVARAQIRAHIHEESVIPDIPTAWQKAGYLKTAEEFRLLYVAMTRARRLLWMSASRKAPFTWNTPNNMDDRAPCPALPALVSRFPNSIK